MGDSAVGTTGGGEGEGGGGEGERGGGERGREGRGEGGIDNCIEGIETMFAD